LIGINFLFVLSLFIEFAVSFQAYSLALWVVQKRFFGWNKFPLLGGKLAADILDVIFDMQLFCNQFLFF
jgi:hypothetical protein